MSKLVYLTNSTDVAVVDDADYDRVSKHKWWANVTSHTTYAMTCLRDGEKYCNIRMHRFILNATKGQKIDHRDRHGLNNTKDNLRLCSSKQNAHNRGPLLEFRGDAVKSQYKGVTVHGNGIYIAVIREDGRAYYLGSFASEVCAARMYDTIARLLFGEFAYLNFPKEPPLPTPINWKNFKKKSAFVGKGKFVGVTHRRSVWIATCNKDGFNHLGEFDTEEQAVVAYDLLNVWLDKRQARINYAERLDTYMRHADAVIFNSPTTKEFRARLLIQVLDIVRGFKV